MQTSTKQGQGRDARAWKEAERFFRHLCAIDLPRATGMIEVNYPDRFVTGKCVVAVTIPLANETLRKIKSVMKAHDECRYSPAIINHAKKGPCLRLVYQLPGIPSGHRERLSEVAAGCGEFWGRFFNMNAIIFPMGGRINMLWRLRAF